MGAVSLELGQGMLLLLLMLCFKIGKVTGQVTRAERKSRGKIRLSSHRGCINNLMLGEVKSCINKQAFPTDDNVNRRLYARHSLNIYGELRHRCYWRTFIYVLGGLSRVSNTNCSSRGWYWQLPLPLSSAAVSHYRYYTATLWLKKATDKAASNVLSKKKNASILNKTSKTSFCFFATVTSLRRTLKGLFSCLLFRGGSSCSSSNLKKMSEVMRRAVTSRLLWKPDEVHNMHRCDAQTFSVLHTQED